MKIWQKYIEETEAIKPILTAYLKLRRLFQSYDWSESDIEKPPFYSREMMELRDRMSGEIGQVKKELNDLGVDYDLKEFYDYLHQFLIKIDEITPLKNGNNKRRNQRDEDS